MVLGELEEGIKPVISTTPIEYNPKEYIFTIDESSTDTQIPTAKAVYNAMQSLLQQVTNLINS